MQENEVIFNTPYVEYEDLNGAVVEIVGTIITPGPLFDEEVLPMYLVRFSEAVFTEFGYEDGHLFNAYPEELFDSEAYGWSFFYGY